MSNSVFNNFHIKYELYGYIPIYGDSCQRARNP